MSIQELGPKERGGLVLGIDLQVRLILCRIFSWCVQRKIMARFLSETWSVNIEVFFTHDEHTMSRVMIHTYFVLM